MQKTLDVVAAIIEQDGKILLAQRPPHADQPGLWEFAGGKVEPGESQPQALIRELQEELGITAEVERYIASHQREVSGRLIHLHAWWVARFSGLPTAHYHRQLRWCTPQEALAFDLAPADIPLLNAFIAQRTADLPR
ncbi:pyrimidine (deoxy)nucleoside triphosphate diphosphatase [Raoultella planticola]|uniref:pyrimidine (deoxy)nucleoside triphosphate diphosphatase n=1 Tax=Raoultella planticola TaxID=575 RepID=UPI000538F508|nr:pyrimidine (deoxy)nucleoside triphosphate diphosphatase [Raoultella planticola]MDU4421581.1 pyrimidine (deoxy)nucleoside triphosphate diphosphatase [Raoultella sp.]AUU07253.1 (deoxy)nucleoside triphosphate pyrophosphohydrolase [Raoultella planticola]EJR0223903.1 pyrimidine (deoxy)nucleoside triphosphate diphosphatase [Raoultella planticola]EJR0353326.1 pyrimidine (deoxy)nucleoside triphosphate diphosphatase [Raoultella planticola]MCS7492675.1 pyrimidine (deoxy)nucleoside triphosphate diphos